MLNDYCLPSSAREAVQILGDYKGTAKLIAGGTDLMLDLNARELQADCLVDVSGIPELKEIELKDATICIGGGVTHQEVTVSQLILQNAHLLADACRTVGSLQIRNVGTLAGNVVNAQPAADSAVALIALGAEAVILGQNGERKQLVEELYAGVGKSTVDNSKEIITHFNFPALGRNQGSAFVRLARRKALALPMLNIAVVVEVDGNTIKEARIVMAPVGPKPVRATEAEEFLSGTAISDSNLLKAAELCRDLANPRDSALRGSKMYRKPMVSVLALRALKAAIIDAQNL